MNLINIVKSIENINEELRKLTGFVNELLEEGGEKPISEKKKDGPLSAAQLTTATKLCSVAAQETSRDKIKELIRECGGEKLSDLNKTGIEVLVETLKRDYGV